MLIVSQLPRSREPAMGWPHRDGCDEQCFVCRRPVMFDRCRVVYVHDGGSSIVTPSEYQKLNATEPGAGLGLQPIGPTCWRKNAKLLRPYEVSAAP